MVFYLKGYIFTFVLDYMERGIISMWANELEVKCLLLQILEEDKREISDDPW